MPYAVRRHYYYMAGHGLPDDNVSVHDAREDAERFRNLHTERQAECSVYYLSHGEHSAPDYTVTNINRRTYDKFVEQRGDNNPQLYLFEED